MALRRLGRPRCSCALRRWDGVLPCVSRRGCTKTSTSRMLTASVDGGILLEWDSDDSDLLLSIDKNGHVTAYLRNGTTEVEGPLSSHQLAVAETLSSFV